VTGIVSAYTRAPGILAQTAAALADLSNGRFVLGLGASSNVIVEQWNGIPFERPLAKVRETVEWLRPVLAGGRSPSGFKLTSPPAEPVPIVLAALRDRMLRLAAQVSDGAFTNFLPLPNAGQVVEAFGAPDKELACRFFSVLGPEEEALPVARRIFCAYATVPVYTEFFRWLGRGEELEPLLAAWAEGDRKRATEVVPEALLRDVFLLGPVESQREQLAAFAEAGITTAVILPFCPPGELEATLEAFAPR
jgi:alkanesulfonate monooxygenase SsuD/methylene tetrahydromethanopterin reductase-like flavin-dependent oxidoreductase (luciferase family)